MPTPPVYWRAPRLLPDLPKEEITIPDPLPEPESSAGSLLFTLLPGLLTAGLMVGIGLATGMGNWLVFSVPIMLVSSLVSVLSYVTQRRSTSGKHKKNELAYRRLLHQCEQMLQNLAKEQQQILLRKDPDPEQCLAHTAGLERHLWSRSIGDADFLAARVGLGEQPSTVQVVAPKVDPLKPNPLAQAAQALAKRFRQLPDVPICLPLASAGVAGLAGPRPLVLDAARALLIQIATHHTPDEVKIGAVYAPEEEADWSWLRWLPHTWDNARRQRYLADRREGVHHLFGTIDDLLTRRKNQPGADAKGRSFPFYLVLFLAASSLSEDEPLLQRLQAEGPELGVFTIFLADQAKLLPRGCTCLVRLGEEESFLALIEPTMSSRRIAPDRASRALAERFAVAIAPIRLKRTASMEIPTSVSLLEMLGVRKVEELNVLDRWRRSRTPSRSLAVPLGIAAGGEPLLMDLHERAHGPNGLVAGMVGTGKSELLQTLVASLALHFHPHRLAFVLIDYKGGGMAKPFAGLPHTLGVIDNLQQSGLALRALTSFKVEIERRERLFGEAGVNHIDDYQRLYERGQVQVPLPYLVIVVDEFAEMKTEQPEVAKEFVRIARVGRALGFRLLLAMQKPAGIVDGQIEANTRFRLCLRVAQTEDSQAMLRVPDAAYLTGTGRAFFQVGVNEVFQQFQVAWSGAPYDPEATEADDLLEIASVGLGGRRTVLYSPSRARPVREISQLQALVAHLQEVYTEDCAESGTAVALPKLWLDPLPQQLALEDVRPSRGWTGKGWSPVQSWLAPVVGRLDDPGHQSQPPFQLDLGRRGHLALYGAPGYGKTTFVQTLILSLAQDHSPADVQLYLLDLGGHLLRMYEPLPHVGAVIARDEEERLARLWRFLRKEMEARMDRLGQARAHSLYDYRQRGGERMPAIVVVLDNYAGFIESYPDDEEVLVQLAREGANLGIHLVLTADRSSTVRFRVGGNIAMALALHLAQPGEFGSILGRTDGMAPSPLPGRGLCRPPHEPLPLEFQTALPCPGESDGERNAGVERLIDAMRAAWQGERPRPIETLPNVVALSDARLLPPGERWQPGQAPSPGPLAVPVGLEASEITPCLVDLRSGSSYLIAGPGQSGKTTLLQTWLLALAECFAPECLEMYLLNSQRMGLAPLAGLPHCRANACNAQQVGDALRAVKDTLDARKRAIDEARQQAQGVLDPQELVGRYPALVIAVDDLLDPSDDLTADEDRALLAELARTGGRLGCHILGSYTAAPESYSAKEPVRALKALQSGFMLGRGDDTVFANLRLPRGEREEELPPGLGYWVYRGGFCKVRVATPQRGPLTLAAWVERLARRCLTGPTAGA